MPCSCSLFPRVPSGAFMLLTHGSDLTPTWGMTTEFLLFVLQIPQGISADSQDTAPSRPLAEAPDKEQSQAGRTPCCFVVTGRGEHMGMNYSFAPGQSSSTLPGRRGRHICLMNFLEKEGRYICPHRGVWHENFLSLVSLSYFSPALIHLYFFPCAHLGVSLHLFSVPWSPLIPSHHLFFPCASLTLFTSSASLCSAFLQEAAEPKRGAGKSQHWMFWHCSGFYQ